MPIPAPDRFVAVYRLSDALGQLLYVGITVDPEVRFKNHEKEKWWWPSVYQTDIDWMLNWEIAESVEKHLIKTLSPIHNVRGTPRHGKWSHIAAQASTSSEWRQLAKEHGVPFTSTSAYSGKDRNAMWTRARLAARRQAERLMVITATDLRRRFSSWFALVEEQGRHLVITHRGVPDVVLMPIADYEAGCRALGEPFDAAAFVAQQSA